MEVTQSWRQTRWQAKAAITYCLSMCYDKSCGMSRSVCVWVCIYETLHSSFSSNVATWVVVCISRASPGSLPASWQHCGPIYGLRQQINQHRHSDKSSATSTDLKERVKATLEESIFRKEDTACLMQRAPLEVCVIHISKWRPTTSLWINIRKRVRSWQQFNSFQDMQLF